jgi:hypothetical protein
MNDAVFEGSGRIQKRELVKSISRIATALSRSSFKSTRPQR